MKSYSRLSRVQVHELIEFLKRNSEDNQLLYSHGELVKKAIEELGFTVNRSHIASFASDLGIKSKNPRPPGTIPAHVQQLEVSKSIESRLERLEQQVRKLSEKVA